MSSAIAQYVGLEPSVDFSFAAFGDTGYSTNFQANLNLMNSLGVAFGLHVGDLAYACTAADQSGGVKEYIDRVKATLGSKPLMLTAGNHENSTACSLNRIIYDYTAKLPPLLPLDPEAQATPTAWYGKRYYFDYPTQNPYMRFIMVTPYTLDNLAENRYYKGTTYYNWVSAAIDDARARGYAWIVIGFHRNYISAGGKPNEVGVDIMELCLTKKVDMIIQGHEHNYQRSYGLGPPMSPLAIVDPGIDSNGDGVADVFTRGLGTMLVINGLGGTTNTDGYSTGDSDSRFFAAYHGNGAAKPLPLTGTTITYGSVYVQVSRTQLVCAFRPAIGGAYKDDYVIR